MVGQSHGNYPSEKTKQPRGKRAQNFWAEMDAANARREATMAAAAKAFLEKHPLTSKVEL
jgi:hypothetical protein